MKQGLCLFHLALLLVFATPLPGAQDMDGNTVVKETLSTYVNMRTFIAKGTSVSNISTNERTDTIEHTFSIKLSKPKLYNIAWSQEMPRIAFMSPQEGAVWNAGDGPYLYMGQIGYSKMSNDDMALASATGISSGAANTIPSLFFKGYSFLNMLEDVSVLKEEAIDGEDCYVLKATSRISNEHIVWISKKRLVILKHQHSLEKPVAKNSSPRMTDELIKQTLRALNKEVTEESIADMKKMMENANTMTETLKGTKTETYKNIKIDSELTKGDFEYKVPEGAVLKKSLFDGAFSK